jgi:hypothetical protein
MKHIKLFEDLDEYEKEHGDPAGFVNGARIIFTALGKNMKGKITGITADKITVEDEKKDKHEIKRSDIIYPPFFKKTPFKEKEPEAVQAVEESKKTSPKDLQMVEADYKDIDELKSSFIKALKKFGINVYDSPESEGSDTYILYLTKEKLTKSQLKDIDEENIPG